MNVIEGQKYLSNIENSSGRTYQVMSITFNESAGGLTVKLKDVNSIMTATFSLSKVQNYIMEGRLKLIEPVKLNESWNQKWPERNESGTYLEGNLCRREGANTFQTKLIELLEKYKDRQIAANYVITLIKQLEA